MSDTNQEWVEKITSIYNDSQFINDVKTIKSKSLLSEIATYEKKYSFDFVESRIVRNATATSFMIENLASQEITRLKELEPLSLKSALVWENLGRLNERTDKAKAFMNSAILYEIAGYQANASCLSRYVHELVEEESFSVVKLASIFLQRQFLGINRMADVICKEPSEFVDKPFILGRTALAISARGMSLAGSYFLNGNNDLLKQATNDLKDGEGIFADIGSIEEANILRSLRNLLPVMITRSTWKTLKQLVPESKLWERYLKLLARGFGTNLLKSSSISELWPSQLSAIENNLLSSESKVVKMPTSAGKTRIAELSIIHSLVTNPDSKCVYIAPYRALVTELKQVLLNLFDDLGFKVSTVVGSYETDEFEEQLIEDADILILTPEKLDLLFRTNSEFLNKVSLFILDEGHIINEENRGIKFELLLTRLKRKLTRTRFLFLSAVVPRETLEDFAAWLKTEESGIIESSWRPTIQRYAKFNWAGEWGVIRYSIQDDNPLMQGFVPGVIRKNEYEFVNPKTNRINRKKFPDPANRAQTSAELAFQFSRLGPVLVFCSQPNNAIAVAKAIQTRLNYSRLAKKSIPEFFYRNENFRSVMVSEQWLGKDHIVTKLLRDGIAVHHGRLPDSLRNAIETDFRERNIQVIVATRTLAQGVNLPIKTVIIHSSRIYSEYYGILQRIPGRDYWNIAGRAGRAGRETEGTIIHISLNENDEDDFEYYLEQRTKLDPIRTALFNLMENLYYERISVDEVRQKLDAELIALLVEESYEDPEYEKIEDLLDETLTKRQLVKGQRNVENFYKAFKNAANTIKNDIVDDSYWDIYSRTGLNTKSCETIRNFIESNKEEVKFLLSQKTDVELTNIVKMLITAVGNLQEIRPRREIDVDYVELLNDWLSGKDVYEFSSKYEEQDTERLARFIEEFFGYSLTWGISGFLKIAMHILKLEEGDLPNNIKFLPSMVKHGVPTPESSWAMSAGIPFRKTAIEIGLKFSADNLEHTYVDFMEWLSKLDDEKLRKEFHLKSPFLEEVSYSISRRTLNPLLKDLGKISEILSHGNWVRGISYENRVIVARSAQVGDMIELVRDYDNPVDRNAIKILLKNKDLGFVERDLAQLIAPEIDVGIKLKGKIIEIQNGEYPKIKIQMKTIL